MHPFEPQSIRGATVQTLLADARMRRDSSEATTMSHRTRSTIAPALIDAALSGAATSIHRKAGDPAPGHAAVTSAIVGGASGAALGAWSPEERWHRVRSNQRFRKDRE
jgi:hypothetical protein